MEKQKNKEKKILDFCEEYEYRAREVITLYCIVFAMLQENGEKELRDVVSETFGFIDPYTEDKILKARKVIEKLK